MLGSSGFGYKHFVQAMPFVDALQWPSVMSQEADLIEHSNTLLMESDLKGKS